ncbi:MAG: hypothetical protein HOE44_02195, partial [Candidatus Marinimicrobia bacterium]|nr:hypothetical protein [Candidatus Neomarinimicrobiota bacterium]MBT4994297.1 hypothetical protein [Candidatus Neomarinimicrobiota bacterium]
MKHSYKLVNLVLAILLFAMVPVTLSAENANMSFLGNWGAGGGDIRGVANFGDLVYYGVTDQFTITSFEDPANPFTSATLNLDDMIEDIVWKVSDGTTYVLATAGQTLKIIDATNPLDPTVLSTLALAGYGEGLAVSGNYAYVTAGVSGMEVIDISDPTSPSSVAVVVGGATGPWAEGINVSGDYAYVGNGSHADIYDISTPTSPSLISTIANTDGWVQDAMPISNYLYVCVWSSGIDVYDISDPASPTFVTALSNPKNSDIMFDGNYGYIASKESGVTVLDVSDPAAPTTLGIHDTEGSVRKISFGSINMGGTQTGHIFAGEESALSA